MKRISAFALSFISAAALATSTSAEAPKPLRGLAVAPMRTTLPAPMKAPRAYTKQQKAMALAKALNLAMPPVLGEPVSITPDRLAIPGLVKTMFGGIKWMSHDGASSIMVLVHGPSQSVVLTFLTQQGKHYAIDCRTSADKIVYEVGQSLASTTKGEAASSPDNHAIFATPEMQQDGWYNVRMQFTDSASYPSEGAFWGCEISPF
jgi:hypothetical protein